MRAVRWVPTALCMAVIFALSSRTGGELNTWLPWFQRILPALPSFDPVHYAAYFVLALAVAYGLGRRAFTGPGGLWILGICILYGVTDEWHQAYVPNRTPDLLDLKHDAIGAAVACLLLQVIRRLRRRR